MLIEYYYVLEDIKMKKDKIFCYKVVFGVEGGVGEISN